MIWGYTRKGVRSHARALHDDEIAACGLDVEDYTNWHGTGTQDEYEKAERLPRCKHCVQVLGSMK